VATKSTNAGARPVRRLAASIERKSLKDPMGLEQQYAINLERANAEGYEIPDDAAFRFSDDATSGVLHKRDEFDRLKDLVDDGDHQFDRLYVKDRSRFGRWTDPRWHYYYELWFLERGVLIRYCDEDEPARNPSEEDEGKVWGRFFRGAVGTLSSGAERTKLIKRIVDGTRDHLLAGFYPGSMAPYGTTRFLADERSGALMRELPDRGRVREDGMRYKLAWATDDTLDVVRSIFEQYDSGESKLGIVRGLNERGVRAPRMRRKVSLTDAETEEVEDNGCWTPGSIDHILRNEIYVGDLVWGLGSAPDQEPVPHTEAKITDRTPIRFTGFLPNAPITREQWDRVQARLAAERSRTANRRVGQPMFLLAGMLSCAECGRPLHGHGGARLKGRRYYRHELPTRPTSRRRASACSAANRYVRVESLEESVLASARVLLEDDRLVPLAEAEVARRLGDEGTAARRREIAHVETALAERVESMARAADAAARAKHPKAREQHEAAVERIAAEIEADEKRLRELGAELEALEKARARAPNAIRRLADARAAFDTAETDRRREVLRELFAALRVDFEANTLELRARAL
jgi:hypothetical protein